jgi:hypothetical protein
MAPTSHDLEQQSRQRSTMFEKDYHDNCIHRDIQTVVLRPSQENLCRAATQMNGHRNHLAPSDLTDDQLDRIRNLNPVHRLRGKNFALKNEMQTLYDARL